MLSRLISYLLLLTFIIVASIIAGPVGFIIAILIISSYISNSRINHDSVQPSPTMDDTIYRVPRAYYDDYRAYLKSQDWYKLRKIIIRRDNHRCTKCGYIGHLQVHHLHYNGIETMDFKEDQLISVCKECHDDLHKKDRLWKY